MIDLKQGDCLEIMKDIPDESIDMVLCDLPDGTTQCSWDIVIPFEPLWKEYKRIIKDNGAVLLFSAQPFTGELIMSNKKMFRYEIIWKKTQPMGFLNAHKMPMRCHENILVFYKKLPTYNPIMRQVKCRGIGRKRGNSGNAKQYNEFRKDDYEWTETGRRFPLDVIEFSNQNGVVYGNNEKATKHPTQKPVPLLEYLIKTYTNEGETVLDNCMGSGSTGVACIHTNRNFIGIELDKKYFQIASERIEKEMEEYELRETVECFEGQRKRIEEMMED